MDCNVCGLPLNQAQRSADGRYKSCPKCSTRNGQEHVYYEYPTCFGNTPSRATSLHREGPQSYCVPCRGDNIPTTTGILCSNVQR